MRSPIFLFLLPVFFVFHGFVEYYHNIPLASCWLLALVYSAAALVLYGLFRWWFRDRDRAALISATILSFYFFFGALHDFLKTHMPPLHRYIILLPLTAIVFIGIFLYLKKRHSFGRLPLFLNVLLLIYLLSDVISLSRRAAGTGPALVSVSPLPAGTYRACETCADPDIYFILFDGYSASQVLQEACGYDNSELNSFLVHEGFHIQEHSRSNYPYTPFSLASILNFSYLQNLSDPLHTTSDDFINAQQPIRDNEVIRYLSGRGYEIVNQSIFDLAGHPASFDQPFLPSGSTLITGRTFFNILLRDRGPWLNEHIFRSDKFRTDIFHANQALEARTIAASRKADARPKFLYAHLMMPHYPYLFDSLQRWRERTAPPGKSELDDYLAYLPYTNSRIREMIGAIKKNSGGKAVIIFMSDHGSRVPPKKGREDLDIFYNQHAIYFPDHDYRLLYDSISAVNTFRVVFNKLFRQDLPLLKDSTIMMKLKEEGVQGSMAR